ncbi:Tyrosine-protein phosphatase Lar [Acromyrmex echinatior]|uniref:Tyrosine-protein phosphatase Lar n=1 Tax=Acromyrmex echinatior TaxID=103372 RepID=F4WXQ2_ACREC|nr:Tyrosine-protein phosphatase Lar [Acromyrmex echinatior]
MPSFAITAENLPMGFPMITQAPTTKVVEMGHNAVLLCTAVGSPTPIISWVRDMLPIDTSNPRYTVLDSGIAIKKFYRGENSFDERDVFDWKLDLWLVCVPVHLIKLPVLKIAGRSRMEI